MSPKRESARKMLFMEDGVMRSGCNMNSMTSMMIMSQGGTDARQLTELPLLVSNPTMG